MCAREGVWVLVCLPAVLFCTRATTGQPLQFQGPVLRQPCPQQIQIGSSAHFRVDSTNGIQRATGTPHLFQQCPPQLKTCNVVHISWYNINRNKHQTGGVSRMAAQLLNVHGLFDFYWVACHLRGAPDHFFGKLPMNFLQIVSVPLIGGIDSFWLPIYPLEEPGVQTPKPPIQTTNQEEPENCLL